MPSDPKTLDALYDIRDNILLAQEFIVAIDFRIFLVSRLHVYATTRAVEIISEASRRISDEIRDRHPHLNWRAMRDAGNVYRHEYDNVAEASIWRTVHQELPPLYDAVMAEIKLLEG